MSTKKRNLILDDLASALRLSKSTVSRALSGKGRVSAETRRRVLDYAQAHGYVPNGIASSLARSRTNNIGVVIPAEAFTNEAPFFQQCLLGACEAASQRQYDVLVVPIHENDISALRRIVAQGKVDGVLLTRSLVVDHPAEHLKGAGLPFVTVGSSDDAKVHQVDTDTVSACRELTGELLAAGKRRVALILGDIQYIVNRNRLLGFQAALREAGLSAEPERVITGVAGGQMVKQAAARALAGGADALLCGDDFIALQAAEQLAEQGADLELASFYNSDALRNSPLVTAAVDVDARAYGLTAGNVLIDLLESGEAALRTFIGHRILHYPKQPD